MTMRMLIDARHPEETRVAVAKGNRIEELDFESAEHKQLKGNIYLAKVTRVEPSLQAAFIDYGGNRHGFLAFSEIHPDYYQIPKSDRDALLREEAEHAAEEERLRGNGDYDDDGDHDDDGFEDAPHGEDVHDDDDDRHDDEEQHQDDEDGAEPLVAEEDTGSSRSPVDESAADELRKKRQALRRRYKIQDVIQRRQVLLVQVVKEERGNKGAALTTYLSLAGRYCVLMPNTSHGGGISRKISNGADRKRLKSIMSDMSLPSTMGLIVRTAGLQRTKVEIKRDFDYLARLWDEIRERTLGSSAPALIYRDSDLIKRAIRDLYHREIDEVIIEGEEGYKAARGYMKLLMPSHVRRIAHYADPTPIFQRYGIEDQLSAMYQPLVQLKSGGYLVINPTEALVSIDINSGRSTREHNIEQTAFATNIEAANEIARQLRLRDMAGLVVIDFIDMEQSGHVRKVERAMKDALKNDRARIQVGRISSFGLMEMSRQRLRTGVLEASTRQCPHCEGTGLVRTASSAGLSALRMLEDEAARGNGSKLTLRASQEAALYVLNRKRGELAEIEARYGVTIDILSDGETEGARMSVEASGPPPAFRPKFEVIVDDDDFEVPDDDEADADEEDEGEGDDEERSQAERPERGDGARRGRARRRRGRRGRKDGETGTDRGDENQPELDVEASENEGGDEPSAHREPGDEQDSDSEAKRRNRRGRRGGRRRRGGDMPTEDGVEAGPDAGPDAGMAEPEPPVGETEAGPAKKPRRRATKKDDVSPDEVVVAEVVVVDVAPEIPVEKPKRGRKPKAETVEAASEVVTSVETPVAPKRARAKKGAAATVATADTLSTATGDDGEPRKGWWQRTFGNEE